MPSSQHYFRLGRAEHEFSEAPDVNDHASKILAWLAAVLQAEHLNLLVGSGFTRAVAGIAGVTAAGMNPVTFAPEGSDQVAVAAEESAKRLGRDGMNLEDQLRAALHLLGGLEIEDSSRAAEWRQAISDSLDTLANEVLDTERSLRVPLGSDRGDGAQARGALVRFLLAFAHRTATRERLHVFTTNYDRLVEHGCDLAGLRCLDRFVGALEPVFRASRLDVDLHYSPPGMRGEPRYLEGVLRLSKLHGSLDWRASSAGVKRDGLPFGPDEDHPSVPKDPLANLLIYPNAAKDVETLEYPYAELFRDAAAALCRPNTALVTYGYGFGDDHVNRVIADMLTIPSTHLVAISYDWADGRISNFLDDAGHSAQTTLLVGDHFGDLLTLTQNYLPAQSLERLTARQVEWQGRHPDANRPTSSLGNIDG
jgi:SIR2-like domain